MQQRNDIVIIKPENLEQYKKWLKTELGFEIDSKYEFYYNTVVSHLKTEFENCIFWQNVKQNLKEYDDEYFVSKGVHLLNPNILPTIFVKPLESVLIKSFRKNILIRVCL